ncbi:VanZ family protein [Lacibacter sp. H407]|uniref:VanZ family protein n=1 Tax=Lacibacter sp. H407 TaxID=3133423 RepID=UPI0030C082A2
MKKKIQQYLLTKWPAIIWSVIIFLLLAMPPINLGEKQVIGFSGLDKFIHFFLFGLMVFLWGFYQQQFISSGKLFFKKLLIIVVIATLYGIAMEYVQGWVGRDFDVWDMVADAAGAFVAGFWLLIQKRRPW